jgi:hypothetical protein
MGEFGNNHAELANAVIGEAYLAGQDYSYIDGPKAKMFFDGVMTKRFGVKIGELYF